eukprot:757042-Hanusia_phi.AAC.1
MLRSHLPGAAPNAYPQMSLPHLHLNSRTPHWLCTFSEKVPLTHDRYPTPFNHHPFLWEVKIDRASPSLHRVHLSALSALRVAAASERSARAGPGPQPRNLRHAIIRGPIPGSRADLVAGRPG